MTLRNRSTWGSKAANAALPPSSHATTDEGHPAHQPEPDHNKYKNGDTSSWAEDVNKNPVPTGNKQKDPPAMPSEAGDHPAAKRAAEERARKARQELEVSAQRKAHKCIRIASALLGKKATANQIEAQALDLMNLPDSSVEASLQRMSELSVEGPGEDVDTLSADEWDGDPEVFQAMDSDEDGQVTEEQVASKLGKKLASAMFAAKKAARVKNAGKDAPPEDKEAASKRAEADEDEKTEKMLAAMLASAMFAAKKAARVKNAGEDAPPEDKEAASKRAEADEDEKTEKMLAAMLASAMFAAKKAARVKNAGEDAPPEDKEAASKRAEADEDEKTEKMLAAMLAEEECGEKGKEASATSKSANFGLTAEEQKMLAEMEAEMAKDEGEGEGDKTAELVEEPVVEEPAGEFNVTFDDVDPLAIDDGTAAVPDDDLSVLYAGTEPTPPAEEEAAKKAAALKAARTAAAKPAPARKPGVKSLGSVTASARTASDALGDLSSLWRSDPDVSAAFPTGAN